jgi:hypothetical protein
MAVQELGGIAEIEGWEAPVQKAAIIRLFGTLKSFARKKPLGVVCGVIVLFFFVIGDVVPETANKFAKTPIAAGAGHCQTGSRNAGALPGRPVSRDFSVPLPVREAGLRARLQGSSSKHLLALTPLDATSSAA